MEKSSAIRLELKDLDTNKRTALIMHSVYNSIDKVGDIAHKGMFTRSWNASKPAFHINHNPDKIPGHTLRTFEDDNAAYTEVKFGNWTLGNDALEMADEGIFTGASFGYKALDKDYSQQNGRKVRNLREVKHIETSLLTVEAAHPGAGLISLVKSIETAEDINELLTAGDEYLQALKSYVGKIETYCRNATASDESIQWLQKTANEYKQLISTLDTAVTHVANGPAASEEEMEAITTFLTHLKIETWQKQNRSPNN